MTSRRFPAPWSVEQIPGGYKVLDASGQALAYIYARDKQADADIAHVLTADEARRITGDIAKPLGLLGQAKQVHSLAESSCRLKAVILAVRSSARRRQRSDERESSRQVPWPLRRG